MVCIWQNGKNFKGNRQETTQRRMYDRSNINNTRQEDKSEVNNKIRVLQEDDAGD